MDRQRLLLNPLNGRQSLKKQHQQQRSRAPDEYYQQGHGQGYMLNNGAVVYADLALSQRRPYLPQHVPLPVYHPHPHSRPHTEYAVIKFHDVGQEIDVWGGSRPSHIHLFFKESVSIINNVEISLSTTNNDRTTKFNKNNLFNSNDFTI